MYELVQDDLGFIWDYLTSFFDFKFSSRASRDFQAVLLAPHLWSPEPCEAELKGTSPWSPSFQPRFSILSTGARQLFFASLVAMGVAGAVRAPVPKWQPVDGAEVLLETGWNMLKQVETGSNGRHFESENSWGLRRGVLSLSASLPGGFWNTHHSALTI